MKNLSFTRKTIIGIQFLFVAFGATVLVPLLVGIEPSLALFSAGIGTLLFHWVTKGKVPVFLGSSFAFIAPILQATKQFGYAGMLSGVIAVGVVYSTVSILVKWKGLKLIERIFPSIVVGPIIMVIGLSLASVAVDMAKTDWLIALVSLMTAVIIVIYTKGLINLIPIFMGIVAGYVLSILLGKVDYSTVTSASWIELPAFTLPEWN